MRPRSAMMPLQVESARRIVNDSELALLLELGSGKTAATMTGLVDRRALPALVVAPARVAETVWDAEAREWDHLAGLRVTPLVGTAKERERLLATDSDIFTVSYESLIWLTDECDIDSRFRALVFDELSRMKTPGSKRFIRMRYRGLQIPVRLGLTGSPVPNHLLDLWGEMFTIAGEKPLGARYGDFKTRYFEPVDWEGHVWKLKGMERTKTRDETGRKITLYTPTDVSCRLEREIHQRVAPWCFVAPPALRVALPSVQVNEIAVPMPASVSTKQRELVDELVTTLDSGIELEAIQASTVAVKLRQFASGAVYTDKLGAWEEIHDAKIRALDDMLGELQGEPALIFYWYKHEKDRIETLLRRTGRVFADVDEPGAIARWNARQLEVLLAHPQSAGHGLNLQHGGHHLIWFALPWSHELWKQGNGRLARTGQLSPFVRASCLLCGAADRAVMATLHRKAGDEEALLETLGQGAVGWPWFRALARLAYPPVGG